MRKVGKLDTTGHSTSDIIGRSRCREMPNGEAAVRHQRGGSFKQFLSFPSFTEAANSRTSAARSTTHNELIPSSFHKTNADKHHQSTNKQTYNNEAPSNFPLGRIHIGLCACQHDLPTSSGNCSLRTCG